VSPEWAHLGFLVVDPSIQAEAVTMLKLQHHPPTSLLVELLAKTPPKDDSQARKWFGILAGRIAGKFNLSGYLKLIMRPRFYLRTTRSTVADAHSAHWWSPFEQG
jgi:Protein of unknown function (DUF3684)